MQMSPENQQVLEDCCPLVTLVCSSLNSSKALVVKAARGAGYCCGAMRRKSAGLLLG